MRAIKIDTEGTASVIDANLDAIQFAIGQDTPLGHATPRMLDFEVPDNVGITMWVDDIGHLRQEKPDVNILATGLYGTGHLIVGNVVLQAFSRLDGETVDMPESIIKELVHPQGEST